MLSNICGWRMRPGRDKQILADLGTAYLIWKSEPGNRVVEWIIAGDASLDDLRLYLNTLTKQGLADPRASA